MFSSPEAATAKPVSSRICGDSHMAAFIRGFPWSGSALGSIEQWSDSLVSTVNFMLGSPASTILMVGPELIVLYNDAYLPTLAERHPRALGMRGDLLWADAWDAVGHQIEAVNATGVSFKHDNVLIPVERNGIVKDTYFTYSFSPVFESRDNGIAGVVCMAQDVTAAHQAMLDLAESERKLSATAAELNQLMSATTDAIVSVNRNWEFSYLNPAAIRTYAFGRNLIGKRLWEEFPDAVYPGSPYVEHYERAMYENKTGTFEAYYPEPLDLWLRLSVFPTDYGFVSFSRDITEEKRTASVLLQTEKLAAVGRLASSIAHEINNPLEAVTNLLYIARTEENLERVRELLHTADDELRRVAVIANQTLGFHKQASRPREVTCLELFSGTLNLYRAKLNNSRVQVDPKRASQHTIVVYEGEIRQVMNNLFSNAIDAMPHGGKLMIRSRNATNFRTGEHGMLLTIADTGTGIPVEKLTRIFDAFYTTKGIGGTGLGLWISKDILARHNGQLRVRSSQDARHHGSVFTLFIPYENPAAIALREQQHTVVPE